MSDDRPLGRRLLAQLLGSAFLAALVIGSGIAAHQLSPGNVGLQLLGFILAQLAGGAVAIARSGCCIRM